VYNYRILLLLIRSIMQCVFPARHPGLTES